LTGTKGALNKAATFVLIPSNVLDSIDSSFGHWFAGFTDGEGSFLLLENRNRTHPQWRPSTVPRFSLGQRADDVAVMELIHSTLGMGKLRLNDSTGTRNAKPIIEFNIWRIAECLDVIDLFTRFPLRAKKAHQFEVWARGVNEIARGSMRDQAVIDACRTKLASLRVYDEDILAGWTPAERPKLVHRADYGTAPLCLCGCGLPVKVHGGRGIPHPENQSYARFIRGHHMRTPQSRARIRMAFRGY